MKGKILSTAVAVFRDERVKRKRRGKRSQRNIRKSRRCVSAGKRAGPNLSKQVAGLGCMGWGDEEPSGEDGHKVGHGGAMPQQAMVAHVQFLQPR